MRSRYTEPLTRLREALYGAGFRQNPTEVWQPLEYQLGEYGRAFRVRLEPTRSATRTQAPHLTVHFEDTGVHWSLPDTIPTTSVENLTPRRAETAIARYLDENSGTFTAFRAEKEVKQALSA